MVWGGITATRGAQVCGPVKEKSIGPTTSAQNGMSLWKVVDYGPRGPQHLIVLILMAVAMLPILLRPGSQRTLDFVYEHNTLNPRGEAVCGPPGGKPLNLFILTFCGLLGLQLGLLGFHTGFLDLAGLAFRPFQSGAWLLSWGSSGL